MTKLLCSAVMVFAVMVFCGCAWGDVEINAANFPDSVFCKYILDEFDSDGNNVLNEEEIEDIVEINVSEMEITSLQGIEYLESLETLNCDGNGLTALDLSNNTKLTSLSCINNRLKELNIGRNTALIYLWCNNNQLKELDVSRNTVLTTLDCSGNSITALDIRRNTELTEMNCWNNQITELDISRNTKLTWLRCWDNQLTELDISQNTALDYLDCDGNMLTALDLSNNTELTGLDCRNNLFTSLDISRNTKLTVIWCYNNRLAGLDISRHTALTELYCEDNQLTELDISRNTALQCLNCSGNQLTKLDISRNTELTELECGNNHLSALDLSSVVLESIDCSSQEISINGSEIISTGSTEYQYSFTLTALNPQIVPYYVINLNAYDSGGTSINTSFDHVNGTIEFASFPASITYDYDVQDSAMTTYMDVTITISAQDTNIPPEPAEIGVTITSPSSRIITVPSEGGTFTATAKVSGMTSNKILWLVIPSGRISATITPYTVSAEISGTVPATFSSSARSYDVTVNAYENSARSFTDKFTVVQEGRDSSYSPSGGDMFSFTMSSALIGGILSAFPGLSENNIYQFTDSEIISSTWYISDGDTQELEDMKEEAVLKIPAVVPNNMGVYVVRLNLTDIEAGTNIVLHGFSEERRSIGASAIEDMKYVLFDENGNAVTRVPENGIVYAAIRTPAGAHIRGAISAPSVSSSDIASGTIMPVAPEEHELLAEKIAAKMSIGAEEVKFIAEKNILPALEPTQSMINDARRNQYNLVGKLNTLSVDAPGYYVFKVRLSDSLFGQLSGVKVSKVALYGYAADTLSGYLAMASVLSLFNDTLDLWEFFTDDGEEMNKFDWAEFLITVFLEPEEPLMLYIAKAVIAVLTGGAGAGCSAGLGLSGAAGALAAIIFIGLRKRR